MAGTGFAETTPYGNLECGRAGSKVKGSRIQGVKAPRAQEFQGLSSKG